MSIKNEVITQPQDIGIADLSNMIRDEVVDGYYDKMEILTTRFETKLLGEHNIMNLVAAIAMADTLGVSENADGLNDKNLSNIVKAVKNISPVEHRLFLSRIDNNTLLIDMLLIQIQKVRKMLWRFLIHLRIM